MALSGDAQVKALALTQPWASLVAFGAKKIETRTWATAYRGQLAIHASKTWSKEDQALCEREPFKAALRGLTAETMPLGRVLAVVEVTGCAAMRHRLGGPRCEACHTAGEIRGHRCDSCDGTGWLIDPYGVPEPERSFGGYEVGRFGIFIERPRLVPHPVAARGQLSIYELDREVSEAVTAQLEDVAERAAILMADAGLSPADADRLAFDYVRDDAREEEARPKPEKKKAKAKR